MRFTCKRYALDNSVLLMWAIDPMLDLAFDVIESKVSLIRPLGLLGQKQTRQIWECLQV